MPVTPRDWSDPFLEQAKADLNVAWSINPELRGSTFCMLLQMVFEKIAKAFYTRSGQTVPRTHKVASHLFQILLRHPKSSTLLPNSNVEQFIQELELAHPSLAGRQTPVWPQLEYPWEESGFIYYPERDLSLVKRVSNPKDRIALDCLKFASAMIDQIKIIIP